MKDFCKTCPDRGAVFCALVDSQPVTWRDKAALAVGYAAVVPRLMAFQEATAHLDDLREPFLQVEQDTAACVRAHQPDHHATTQRTRPLEAAPWPVARLAAWESQHLQPPA